MTCLGSPPKMIENFRIKIGREGNLVQEATGYEPKKAEAELPAVIPTYQRPNRSLDHAKSEKPQISHHPGGPCNKESQGEFGPVQMRP